MKHLMLLLAWVWVLIAPTAHAKDGLEINDSSQPRIALNQWMDISTKEVMSLNALMRLSEDDWQPLKTGDTERIGVSQFWFRLKVANGLGYNYRILSLNNPLLDRIEIFHLENGRLIDQAIMGDSLPFSQRPVKSTGFLFPIEMEPNSEHTLYVRIDSRGAAHLNFMLLSPKLMYQQMESYLLLNGAQLGALAAIGLFSLFIALTSKSFSYAYYSGYVLSMTLLVAAINGFAFRFLWPSLPQMQLYAIPFLIPLVMAFAVMFTEKLLQLKRHSVRQLQLSRATAAIAVLISLISPLMPYDLAIRIQIIMVLAISSMLMFFAIRQAIKGDRLARLYSIGWCTMLAGALYTGLLYLGVLHADYKPQLPVMVGLTFEVVFMAAVLAIRYNDERRAKQAMQEKALEQAQRLQDLREEALRDEEKTKQQLERMVQERTLELEITLRELNEANQKLTEKATVDSLTQLKNRRAFDKRLVAEGRISRRQQTALSLLMADVDHFKAINDSYGHLAGDEILRQVAELLQSQLKRPSDLLSRFGGEEFAIILPNTSAEGAILLAEQIREAVLDADIEWEGKAIPLTISVGVSAAIIESDEHPTELLEQADKALYQAKQTGRNKVCLYSPKDTTVTEFRSRM